MASSLTSLTVSTSLTVLTYNIMLPVPEPIRYYGQTERADRVKSIIESIQSDSKIDCIVFNELITPYAQKRVLQDMKDLGFIYQTTKLSTLFAVTGGIFIVSKHPIIREELNIFKSSSGYDRLSAKGIVYAAIQTDSMICHLLGTHLQSWPDQTETRVKQVRQMSDFIRSLNINPAEPLLLAGDLNMDFYLNRDQYNYLSNTLRFILPTISENSHPFTMDPEHNILVGSDLPGKYGCEEDYYKTLKCSCCPAEFLDYILFSEKHLKPSSSESRVILAKTPQPFRMKLTKTKMVDSYDVSDHFPVLAKLVFQPVLNESKSTDRTDSDQPKMPGISDISGISDIPTTGLVVMIVLLSIGFFGLCRWILKDLEASVKASDYMKFVEAFVVNENKHRLK